jgi:RsiW-degrading membrane proteinase PrsW (M82 family)
MLWDAMMAFLKSWFIYPELEAQLILISIGLAIVYGVIWLTSQWPPLAKKPWLLGVAVASVFLTVLAGTFVQTPVQYYYVQAMQHFWSADTLNDWLLLTYIPIILVTALVLEGAKMIPMVFWWLRSGKKIDLKTGLIIGALAGAGVGIFEAVYTHNQVFLAGWGWDAVTYNAWQGLLPFWDQFWAVAVHIGISAIIGYGLAKGKGWQFYLLGSALHGILLYARVLYAKDLLSLNAVEIILAAVAGALMLIVLWLRWRKYGGEAPIAPPEVKSPAPGQPTLV